MAGTRIFPYFFKDQGKNGTFSGTHLQSSQYSADQVEEDMETIDKYLRSNDLAREQVLRLIKDGRFEK